METDTDTLLLEAVEASTGEYYRETTQLLKRELAACGLQIIAWRSIEEAPCDDTFALIYWQDGNMSHEDFNHDSDPEWWKAAGATHFALIDPPALTTTGDA